MIYAKTDERGANVSIEGESEDLLHEPAQIGSALYNAARSGLEEGYYDDAEEDYDDCYEYCEIKRGDHFYYRDREFICLESKPLQSWRMTGTISCRSATTVTSGFTREELTLSRKGIRTLRGGNRSTPGQKIAFFLGLLDRAPPVRYGRSGEEGGGNRGGQKSSP